MTRARGMISAPLYSFHFIFLFSRYPFRRKLTISLSALRGGTLANNTLLLEVEVPGLFLAAGVLEVERNDGLGLVDGVLALSGVGLEGRVDHVERGGGGELVCSEGRELLAPRATDMAVRQMERLESKTTGQVVACGERIPFLRDMVGGIE